MTDMISCRTYRERIHTVSFSPEPTAQQFFSAGKYMLVKQQPQISEKELAEFFPEADLILLEGFKYSTYPKIEIIRKGNSAESVCNPEKLMAIATNLDAEERDALSVLENVPFFELDNAECIAEFILSDYFR